MKETLIDIETYSEVDIGKCGLYRYATDPSFEILLVAWATDEGEGFGETRCADLASGEPLPKELLEDFQSGNVRLIAHNASFERVCFSVHLQRHLPGQYLKPGEFLSPDSWICTMVMAASLTLPMALKDVGTVLKTCQQKDKEGERLIKLFSMPCKPTKSNGMRTRNLPEHYPADWEKFKYYCIQDVNTEVDIYKRLKKFPMPEQEWKHYRVNERINDRGVKIDTELVQQAIACDLMLSDAMSKKAYELTGLENPNSVSQLKAWLDERGIPMDTLGKKDVAQMIAELDKNRRGCRGNGYAETPATDGKKLCEKISGCGTLCLLRWQGQRTVPVLWSQPHWSLFRPEYPVAESAPEPYLHAGRSTGTGEAGLFRYGRNHLWKHPGCALSVDPNHADSKRRL